MSETRRFGEPRGDLGRVRADGMRDFSSVGDVYAVGLCCRDILPPDQLELILHATECSAEVLSKCHSLACKNGTRYGHR
jgi:hypothetical protein